MRTIQPQELGSDKPYGEWSCRGRDTWDAFCAADAGDADGLRQVLSRDPNLYRAEYWYTPPIHFAVRAGRIETTRVRGSCRYLLYPARPRRFTRRVSHIFAVDTPSPCSSPNTTKFIVAPCQMPARKKATK